MLYWLRETRWPHWAEPPDWQCSLVSWETQQHSLWHQKGLFCSKHRKQKIPNIFSEEFSTVCAPVLFMARDPLIKPELHYHYVATKRGPWSRSVSQFHHKAEKRVWNGRCCSVTCNYKQPWRDFFFFKWLEMCPIFSHMPTKTLMMLCKTVWHGHIFSITTCITTASVILLIELVLHVIGRVGSRVAITEQ